MIHNEEIARQTAAYAVLVREGIFAYNLVGNYARPEDDWSIQFSIIGPLSRQQAKRKAETYLSEVYRATGLYFYQRSSDKDNQFRASFHRGDL
jgi:hypothetical protein